MTTHLCRCLSTATRPEITLLQRGEGGDLGRNDAWKPLEGQLQRPERPCAGFSIRVDGSWHICVFDLSNAMHVSDITCRAPCTSTLTLTVDPNTQPCALEPCALEGQLNRPEQPCRGAHRQQSSREFGTHPSTFGGITQPKPASTCIIPVTGTRAARHSESAATLWVSRFELRRLSSSRFRISDFGFPVRVCACLRPETS